MKTKWRNQVLFSSAAVLLTLGAGRINGADYPTTVQSFNPVAYWRLNETTAVPIANTITNSGTLGAAGNGYVVMDATNGVPGIVGTCLKFNNGNGAGPTITYCGSKVDVPYNIALNPNGPFSVEVWANPSSTNSDAAGVCPVTSMNPDTTVDANNRSGFLIYARGAPNAWVFRIGSQHNSYVATPGGGSWRVGAWSHVVGVYDGAGHASLYVNGVLAAGPTAVNAAFEPNRFRNLRIGGSDFPGDLGSAAGNRGWDGLIDEVAVYATALSASTVKAHFDCVTTNNAAYHNLILASSPVGYWPLNEPVYTAPDQSTLPRTANIGTDGAELNGTNFPGVTAGVAGPPFSGFPAASHASSLTGIQGYIGITNADALNFSGPITMIAWVKPNQVDSSPVLRNILAHGFADAEVLFRLNSGFYEVGSWDGANSFTAFTPMPSGDVGNWVFLAGTYDSANWNLYRYDSLVDSEPFGTGALPVAADWSIGGRGDPPDVDGRFFGGSVAEVAIFTNALTAAQLKTIFYSANVPPIIVQAPQPPPPPVFEGPSLTLSVWAEGNAPLSYLWIKNGVSLGVTTTNLTIATLSTNNSGNYAVVVSNPIGSVTNSFVLTVLAGPPQIVQQTTPALANRYIGATIPFSVLALGSPTITYQWMFNNHNISGATSPNFTKVVSQNNDAGNYNCQMTNPYGVTNSLPSAVTVLPAPTKPYPAGVLADNPAWYWRLGETNGSTVAFDYWGGADGTYNNVTLGQPGYSLLDSDTSASFSGALNSYVGQISGTAIDFSSPNPEFSIEAWVNGPSGQTDGAAIVAKGTGGGGEQFDLDVVGGVYRWFVRDINGNVMGPGGNPITAYEGPNGTWQHVVGVYDQAVGNLRLYVNGVLEATAAITTNVLHITSHPVSIGGRRGGVDPNYDLTFLGNIDEVAIYTKALTDSQVLAHYCNQFGGTQPPLIGVQPAPFTKQWIGWPVSLSAVAAGSCTLNYQWFKGNTPLNDTATITGSQSNHLDISAVDFTDAGNYTLHVNNSLGNATSTVAVVTVVSTPTNPLPVAGLVMHLTFDNTLADATGRGNDGTGKHTLFGTTTTVAPSSGNPAFQYVSDGKLGQGLHYSSDGGPPGSGTSSTRGTNDYYVTLGVRPDLQFSSNVNFTVAYWIRLPNNYDQGDLPFLCNALNSTFSPGYTFAPSYGKNAIFTGGTTDGAWAWSLNGTGLYGAPNIINDFVWHHLVHTFNRNGVGTTYLDGVNVNITSIAGGGTVDTGQPTNIGQDPTGGYPETGAADIDDLGIWRRELSPFEALGLYVAATNGLSFTDLSPIIKTGSGQVTISWQSGTLQQADTVTGPYTDISPQPPSPYTITPVGKKFYRVRQ